MTPVSNSNKKATVFFMVSAQTKIQHSPHLRLLRRRLQGFWHLPPCSLLGGPVVGRKASEFLSSSENRAYVSDAARRSA